MSTNELAKERTVRLLKKGPASVVSSSATGSQGRGTKGARSISTVSYAEEPNYTQSMRRMVRYENSYQLEPKKRFPVGQVQGILKEVIDGYLQDEKYNPELCRRMTITLSEVIRSRVKDLMLPRFKFVCLVSIGELNEQTTRVVSRCLWNAAHDQSASYEFKNSSLFAVCTVYALYFE